MPFNKAEEQLWQIDIKVTFVRVVVNSECHNALMSFF